MMRLGTWQPQRHPYLYIVNGWAKGMVFNLAPGNPAFSIEMSNGVIEFIHPPTRMIVK